MPSVIFNYIKTAVIVVSDFGLAWLFSLWAKRHLPSFRSRSTRSIFFLTGTALLFIAGVGRIGWDIQTWSGNSPAESLDKWTFIGLSFLGTFLLTLDYLVGKQTEEKDFKQPGQTAKDNEAFDSSPAPRENPMQLEEAERIVHEFATALVIGGETQGPAYFSSRLPCSPEEIVRAMKLWLAHDIKNLSLTQEFHNEMATAVSKLPYFIDDDEAFRFNSAISNILEGKKDELSTDEFIVRTKAAGEAHEWARYAGVKGASLRRELSEFVVAIQLLDPNDPLYWERVYELAEVGYPEE